MTESKVKKSEKPDPRVRVSAVCPPFIVIPTGQVIGATPVAVDVDGWLQANIDKGLLVVCS